MAGVGQVTFMVRPPGAAGFYPVKVMPEARALVSLKVMRAAGAECLVAVNPEMVGRLAAGELLAVEESKRSELLLIKAHGLGRLVDIRL